jgi:IPT/TIG domain-containing protein
MGTSQRRLATRVALVTSLVALATQLFSITPALAAAPTGLAFLPLSGQAGTEVTIVGSGFDDGSPVTGVAFNGAAAAFSIDSDVAMRATVPAGATSGTISVTDAEGTSETLLGFTVSSGGLLPSLTSLVPTSGAPGDTISLIGTGLEDATGVAFNGVPGTLVPSTDGLTAIVPDDATSGPVSLTTPLGLVTSLTNFAVKSRGAAASKHARAVSFALHGKRAQGRVKAPDGFSGCVAGVPVRIQHRGKHSWKTVKAVRTNGSGRFSTVLNRTRGMYRALAPKTTANAGVDVCRRRASAQRRAS